MEVSEKQNDKFELAYWDKHNTPDSVIHRYQKAIVVLKIDRFLSNAESVVDVGCGPFGGIFTVRKYPKMYGVDPLWEAYSKKYNGAPEGVVPVASFAHDFSVDSKVDAIFSMNALDHSGNLKDSIRNFLKQLNEGGKILIHVHMRTKNQLNAGHKMIITEELIEDSFDGLTQIWKKVVPICPFDNKPYKSYLGCWSNE